MQENGTSIIVGLLTIIMPLLMLFANEYIKRQTAEASNDMKNNELLQAQLAATTAAKDRLDAEYKGYKVKTEAEMDSFRDTVAQLISQVHALELWVSKNGIPSAPKWDAGNDSATHVALGGK